MNLKNQPPVFVPTQFRVEIEGLSKAALMDISWNLAQQCTYNQETAEVMDMFRAERDVVLSYRKSAKDAA